MATSQPHDAKTYTVFVGTLGETSGILAGRFDAATGKLSDLAPAVTDIAKPSFIALHPNGRFLYAASEIEGGMAFAYAIAPGGKLTFINKAAVQGVGPAFIAVDPSGRCVLTANYRDGSLSVLPIRADGGVGEPTCVIRNQGASVHPKRQTGPHAHSINVSPDGRFALLCDLGLDKVFVYRLDAVAGKLTPNDPPFAAAQPGAGPRHLVFHPSGRFVDVINELQSSITVYAWDSTAGTLKEVQTVSILPAGFSGESTAAEIRVDASGRFFYGSNRGDDSLCVLAADPETGKLKPIQWIPVGGKIPRNFNLDPTGAWLIAANQASDNLAVFKVDPASGKLTDSGERRAAPLPSCVRFLLQD